MIYFGLGVYSPIPDLCLKTHLTTVTLVYGDYARA